MSCDCDHWMYCDHMRDEPLPDTAAAFRAGYVAGQEDGALGMYLEDKRLQESGYA